MPSQIFVGSVADLKFGMSVYFQKTLFYILNINYVNVNVFVIKSFFLMYLIKM